MRLNSSWYHAFVLASRWLAFRLDLISATSLAAGTLLGVALRGRVSVSLLGLALSYVLQLPGLMQWTVRQSTEVGVPWLGAAGPATAAQKTGPAAHKQPAPCPATHHHHHHPPPPPPTPGGEQHDERGEAAGVHTAAAGAAHAGAGRRGAAARLAR
jgi:hypothetical protein